MMRRTARTSATGVLVLSTLLLCLMAGPPSAVASDDSSVATVRPATLAFFQQVDKDIRAGNIQAAREALPELLQRARGHAHETALAHQYAAFAHAAGDSPGQALRHVDQALQAGTLEHEAVRALRRLAGTVAFQIEAYARSFRDLEAWLAHVDSPDPALLHMTGYAAYRAGKPGAAVALLERALEAGRDEHLDELLQLLVMLYLEAHDHERAETLLIRALGADPDRPEWWRLMAAVYASGEHHDMAFASMVLADLGGWLDAAQLPVLAGMGAQAGVPASAARALERALELGRIAPDHNALSLLARLWLLARERQRALEVLSRSAALAPDGRDYLRLGHLRMELGQWEQAVESLHQALERGGLRRPDRVRLMLAVAHIRARQPDPARALLKPLLQHPEFGLEADYWLDRLESHRP